MGFEKNKFDHCITVWDIEKGVPSETSIVHLIGLSETAHSMCWDKKSLIAGMSGKYIKQFDLRQNPTSTMTNTRAVNGINISPNGRYLASYFDNVVNLFDLRKFSEPVNHFQLPQNLSQISWCPTQSNYLMCLQKDSSRTMNIIDIHFTGPEGEDGAHFIKRTVAPFEIIDRKNRLQLPSKTTLLENICWHPKKSNQLIAVSSTNNSSLLLMELQVPDRTIAIFDKWNKLWGPNSNEIREIPLISPPSTPTDSTNSLHPYGSLMDGDLAEMFQKRIMQDYGQFQELEKNAKTCIDPNLQRVWRLLGQMQKADCFIGLRTILGIVPNSDELTIAQSSQEMKSFNDFPSSGTIRLYRSEERFFSQELCGWSFHKPSSNDISSNLAVFIEELCKKKKYTRAAMLAVFHLRIRMAIDILGRGANDIDDEKSSLRISAIGLAGFSSAGIWKTQCAQAQQQIQDPHLRAIFNFLSDETFAGVLYEEGVSISDRMAFACAFLNDRQLSEYVKLMIQSSIEKGDLNGLLVTGATLDGIQLLQSFVDRTDDVQTAALIGSKIMPPDLQTDNRIQSWILSLRNMMNIWQMWEKRAAFDISIQQSMKASPKSPKSVYLLCSFCGKSVSATLQEDARLRNQTQGNKLSSCPNCRKPLPRCSLCLLHMGTTTTSGFYNPAGMKSKPFQKWFSWCQTCRHGGHTEHLAEWFKTHTECPVTCCNCKCFAIDLPLLKPSDRVGDGLEEFSGKLH
jgi:WD repeat-containing protein mio